MARLRIGKQESGPPTTGYWEAGDWTTDKTGKQWVCVVSGRPGEWDERGKTGPQGIQGPQGPPISSDTLDPLLDEKLPPLVSALGNGTSVLPKTGRAADLTFPLIAGHRGGGANVVPEHTMESYRQAVSTGAKVLDLDVFRIADGTEVCMHDSLMQTTTNITGNTVAQTAQSISKGRVDGTKFYTGWPTDMRIPTLPQVLNEFGGKVTICVEGKNSNGADIAAVVKRFGLVDSVIYSSFSFTDLQAYGAVVGSSAPAMMLIVGNGVPGQSYATLLAANVGWVQCDNGAATTTQVATLVANGLKVLVWNADRHYDYDRWVAAGASIILSNDPQYIDRNTPRSKTDPFALATPYMGQLGSSRTLTNGKLVNASGGNKLTLQGWGSPYGGSAPPTTWSVTFTVTFDGIPSDNTRYAQFRLAMTDKVAASTSDDNYYDLGMRASGQLFIQRYASNAAAGAGQSVSSNAVTTPGDTATIKIDVTPTTIKITRTDQAGTPNVTLTDATIRPRYLYLGHSDGSNTGLATSYSAVTFAP